MRYGSRLSRADQGSGLDGRVSVWCRAVRRVMQLTRTEMDMTWFRRAEHEIKTKLILAKNDSKQNDGIASFRAESAG